MTRRAAALLALAALLPASGAPRFPDARPGVALSFPADHGAHPAFRIEWWYVTGWLKGEDGRERGFQLTFFRTRPGVGEANPSAFAPKQLMFAHAALSDPAVGRLLHGERAARAGLGLAGASTRDMAVRIGDWALARSPDGSYSAVAATRAFALALRLRPTQPPLLQGEGGYSRKGPNPAQASHYYSIPQLAVAGTVVRDGRPMRVAGRAWLDREWSSSLLARGAAGWDWVGLNLDNGGALTAFQVRGQGGRRLWAGGSLRRPSGATVQLGPRDVAFLARRRWRSPRTGALYPVDPVLLVRLPEGVRRLPLTPFFDDQELDARGTGLPVYWEGAVRAPGGRGYLELTGYVEGLRL